MDNTTPPSNKSPGHHSASNALRGVDNALGQGVEPGGDALPEDSRGKGWTQIYDALPPELLCMCERDMPARRCEKFCYVVLHLKG